jgi:hypothetical protein
MTDNIEALLERAGELVADETRNATDPTMLTPDAARLLALLHEALRLGAETFTEASETTAAADYFVTRDRGPVGRWEQTCFLAGIPVRMLSGATAAPAQLRAWLLTLPDAGDKAFKQDSEARSAWLVVRPRFVAFADEARELTTWADAVETGDEDYIPPPPPPPTPEERLAKLKRQAAGWGNDAFVIVGDPFLADCWKTVVVIARERAQMAHDAAFREGGGQPQPAHGLQRRFLMALVPAGDSVFGKFSDHEIATQAWQRLRPNMVKAAAEAEGIVLEPPE